MIPPQFPQRDSRVPIFFLLADVVGVFMDKISNSYNVDVSALRPEILSSIANYTSFNQEDWMHDTLCVIKAMRTSEIPMVASLRLLVSNPFAIQTFILLNSI